MKSLSKEITPIKIINKDGSDKLEAKQFEITRVTEESYVGNLLDKDGKIIAKDRRFLIQSPVNLKADEIAYIRGERPDNSWRINMIKKYIDDSVLIDDKGEKILPYKDDTKKAELLEIVNPVKEEIK